MSSLLRLECKQKNSSNPCRIRIFFFLSYSFRIETIKTFIQSRSCLKNHTRFQTKMGKLYTCFQTKTAQNPTRWGGTYLRSLYKGVLPPGYMPGSREVLKKQNARQSKIFLEFLHNPLDATFSRAIPYRALCRVILVACSLHAA